jgi:hypothetical protein
MADGKKLRICVTTTRGDFDEDFTVEEPVREIKKRALSSEFDPSKSDQYELEFEGTDLAEDEKIETYAERFDWEDGVCLELKKPHSAI